MEIEQAVSGLRRADQQDELPKAFLTRAWLRFLTGTHSGPESAQRDLDEAWEIAEHVAVAAPGSWLYIGLAASCNQTARYNPEAGTP